MNAEIPVLLTHDSTDGKIIDMDIRFGKYCCERKFIWFGPYQPNIYSSNPNYYYTCTSINIEVNRFLQNLKK